MFSSVELDSNAVVTGGMVKDLALKLAKNIRPGSTLAPSAADTHQECIYNLLQAHRTWAHSSNINSNRAWR